MLQKTVGPKFVQTVACNGSAAESRWSLKAFQEPLHRCTVFREIWASGFCCGRRARLCPIVFPAVEDDSELILVLGPGIDAGIAAWQLHEELAAPLLDLRARLRPVVDHEAEMVQPRP